MEMHRIQSRAWRAAFCGFAVLSSALSTGCQTDIGGQSLPSAHYLKDDIQYFPSGPEFKLSREAAAQKAYNEEQAELNR